LSDWPEVIRMDATEQTVQAVQALQALYGSTDPATQKQADDWLTQFQQTAAAWKVADEILSRADTPVQFRFFAAHTMRTKVQFDFYELPVNSHVSLRDSLLNHIEKFKAPDSHAIHTQLAIAIADLAIQMNEAWPNPVQNLFEKYGQTPESYATLLEIIQMLPEENANHKLMTDTHKRVASRERLEQCAPQVLQFVLTLQCPSLQAKKRVLECFLSWIKFTTLQPAEIAQNPIIPECIKYITEGGQFRDLSESATDIVIEVLRMSSTNVVAYQPVIQVVLSLLGGLRAKLEVLVGNGELATVEANEDEILQICRIYVETGECLVPCIMQQSNNPEVADILRVILRCTDLPLQETSSIPLEFWHRLAHEVCRHPEIDAKIDQFQGMYLELLSVVIKQCRVDASGDPFQADDDFIHYRNRMLNLAEDCLEILTPNTALEHVLKSLQDGQRQGVTLQEAHFFCLTCVGARAEVREGSVLWQLIQSLPPLIAQTVQEEAPEAALLHYTKKTAIELLGRLSGWVKTKPYFLRSALDMISVLLDAAPAASPAHILERNKQLQQAASMAFQSICAGGRQLLQDLIPQLTQVYLKTMQLPIRMHLFIVDGVASVVVHLKQDEEFKKGLEQLVGPLVNGLNSERERPQVLSEILDRLTMIIRQVDVTPGSSRAANVGTLISTAFWPLVRQTLVSHPGDPKVVEKSCRLLKHSMRCVKDLFKPHVPEVAQTLVNAFRQHQHSSYLYSAEILANTYPSDPEIVPVLTELFRELSQIGLQCLVNAQDRLEEITELVEDFFGMFDRYLRYVPMIVLEAPTLHPTLQTWHRVIFVQQKDAIEAIIAFIEAVLNSIAEAQRGSSRKERVRIGQLLQPHILQVGPEFVEAIFKLIASVPTRVTQESLPSVLEHVRSAFPQEYPRWLEAGLQHLPPSVASDAEKMQIGSNLLQMDDVYDIVQDLCYRCEQVALRNRSNQKK